METQSGETQPKIEETASSSSPEQDSPAGESIILNKLFPKANQDLDTLFPDPAMKKLLKDVIQTRKKNERFLKKLDLKRTDVNEDDEPPESP